MNKTLDFALVHENNPSNTAVLLFHGMTGSPFEMKKIARALHKAGFDVFCECLCGHGTSPININCVTWQDWVNQADQKFKELKERYENVYLAGLCMGAVLALAISIKHPNAVAGIISLSTTLFLDGWTIPFYNFLMPVGLNTIVRYHYTFPEREPYGVKNEAIRRKIATLQQRNTVALDNYPLSCVYELLKMSKYVRKNLSKVIAPILIIHAKEDDLTSVKSAKLVYAKVTSKNKELIILNESYHLIVLDNEKDFVFEKSIDFINKILTQNEKEYQTA